MTRTQTALYEWTAPDGTPRYLIDPAEWQDGQRWREVPGTLVWYVNPPHPDRGPVWVRDLLPIPEPLPEVHWIDGHPVAMFHLLPEHTKYQVRAGERVWDRRADAVPDVQPVIVDSWPDGTKPVPPTVDGAR